MIFNMVVDTVIRDWVMVVPATEADTEVLGTSIQDLAVYFTHTKDLSYGTNWRDCREHLTS